MSSQHSRGFHLCCVFAILVSFSGAGGGNFESNSVFAYYFHDIQFVSEVTVPCSFSSLRVLLLILHNFSGVFCGSGGLASLSGI